MSFVRNVLVSSFFLPVCSLLSTVIDFGLNAVCIRFFKTDVIVLMIYICLWCVYCMF